MLYVLTLFDGYVYYQVPSHKGHAGQKHHLDQPEHVSITILSINNYIPRWVWVILPDLSGNTLVLASSRHHVRVQAPL